MADSNVVGGNFTTTVSGSVWPAGMPVPLLNDYGAQDQFKNVQTVMESGPDRRARMSSHYMSRGNLSIVVDDVQSELFRQMIIESNDCSNWITDVPLDTGFGVAPHRARITNPRWMVAGLVPGENWRISMQYETDERVRPA